jgi:threonylcarbamoyladenosine tRNA methylthiotransferase MtaB
VTRVRLESLGCRLNTSEIEGLARQLTAAGHRIVGAGEPADLCIFNSCTVTAAASSGSRRLLRQLRRAHPDAVLVATGCFAELEPENARNLGVDVVVDNRHKERLPRLLAEAGLLPAVDSDDPVTRQMEGPVAGRRTRAFVKVQDGCDNRCTFCVVTIARGPGRSRAPDQVIREVRELVALGFREVVLSGVHLGSYGNDLGAPRGLELLVRRILDETPVPRVRLSSLEPWDVEDSLFELFCDPRLLPHLHLPLQSGCDAVLRRMARRTDRTSFARLVTAARSAVPDLSLTTDIMVGFPGETDHEFAESLRFTEEMAFSRLHIFRYSRRRGTAAADMPRQVPSPVAQRRSRRMHTLGIELEQRFNRTVVGTTLPVLWERGEKQGDGLRWSGLTGNYIRVTADTAANTSLFNRVTETRILSTVPGGVFGHVLGEPSSLSHR